MCRRNWRNISSVSYTHLDVYKRQLLECSVSGSVNLQDLDEYNTSSRRIRITATPEEHDAMNKALADFAQNPMEIYPLDKWLSLCYIMCSGYIASSLK